jgi:ADP-ribosylglycohydrolase
MRDKFLMTGNAGSLGRPKYSFGQYTDDSQLARELAESIVNHGGFEPNDFADRIAALFVEERIVGRGRATELAARRLAQGIPWQQAGTPPPAAGNGGAMRAAPIGWIYAAEDPALICAACDQARITHADPRSQAGAAVIALAVAIAMDPAPADPYTVIERLALAADEIALPVGAGMRSLRDHLDLPPDAAQPVIAALGRTPEELAKDPWRGAISPFVTSSVVWSLYSFLRSPDDYWKTICTAIAGGGDADTTAAMAGAISGARLGLDDIPDALARRLHDRGSWPYDALIEFSDRVAALVDSKVRRTAISDSINDW